VASFLVAYQKTAKREGKYTFTEGDRGGETYKGLARNRQPSWPGWALIDAAKLKPGFPENLEADTVLQRFVQEFYRGLWHLFDLDSISCQMLADEIFDTSVNMGPSRAAIFLQESMNVLNNGGTRWPDIHEDGHIGPETLSVMRRLGEYEEFVAKMFICLRGSHYKKIMKNDPTQEQFALSWLRRLSITFTE